MFWCYPLPAGIGAIVIILLILAIPQVPLGLGLGFVFAVLTQNLLATGQIGLLAIVLSVAPAVLMALLVDYQLRSEKKDWGIDEEQGMSFIERLSLRLGVFEFALPFSTIFGYLVFPFFNPTNKTFLYFNIAKDNDQKLKEGFEAWRSACEAYQDVYNSIPSTSIEIFFLILFIIIGLTFLDVFLQEKKEKLEQTRRFISIVNQIKDNRSS